MNPRILKKLSKRADVFIQKNRLTSMKRCVLPLDDDQFESTSIVEAPYLERWSGRLNDSGYFTMLKGTIGYGCVSGYEYPEWESIDAYSLLRMIVTDHLSDLRYYRDDRRLFLCNLHLYNPKKVFELAEIMIKEKAMGK